jgi:hypothetical protein
MNWEVIFGMGEWAGAAAVFITLIFLVRQVRLNSAQLEKQISADLNQMIYTAYDPIYEGNNADVMVKGLHRPEELGETEQYVFNLLMYRQGHAISTAGTRALAGELSPETIKLLANHYHEVLFSTPGGRLWLDAHIDTLGIEPLAVLGFSNRKTGDNT